MSEPKRASDDTLRLNLRTCADNAVDSIRPAADRLHAAVASSNDTAKQLRIAARKARIDSQQRLKAAK